MITETVKAFIGAHIVAVEQLEVLLLMRAHRDRPWTAEQVNDRIKSSVGSVADRLADLESRGFLRKESQSYRYAETNPNDAAVAELATTYAESRFSVIELIFAKPTDKLRVFARAFSIRGDDNG